MLLIFRGLAMITLESIFMKQGYPSRIYANDRFKQFSSERRTGGIDLELFASFNDISLDEIIRWKRYNCDSDSSLNRQYLVSYKIKFNTEVLSNSVIPQA
jgi:hypothetical protein